MTRVLLIIVTIIVTSFYFFPFEFIFLPGMNTKKILAAIGVFLLSINLAKAQNSLLGKDFFFVTIGALIVSMIGFISVTINGTIDYTYASYIMSMWVWLGGAYVVINLMKYVHGYISVELICNYLIMVCVTQCLLGLLMDFVPSLKSFVDGFLGSTGFMGKVENRMYGIGASLDVAGSRFSSVLVIIAFLTLRISATAKRYRCYWYLIAFFIIALIGNMMSRTTTLGLILACSYWGIHSGLLNLRIKKDYIFLWKSMSFVFVLLIPVSIILYKYNDSFYSHIRFAFEGFFSLIELGQWKVTSNEILKNMYVYPETFHTWIIGDGYFENPYALDMNYIGPNWAGYYKQTDVGYLRFIFYFGLIGLTAFSLFMIEVGRICMKKFSDYKILFLMLIFINFVVWFKVSTDIFVIFALFLVVNLKDTTITEQNELI